MDPASAEGVIGDNTLDPDPVPGTLSDLVDGARTKLAAAPNNLERLAVRDDARRIAALAAVVGLDRLRANAASLVEEAERALAANRPGRPGEYGPRHLARSLAEFNAACDEAAHRVMESERRPPRPIPPEGRSPDPERNE